MSPPTKHPVGSAGYFVPLGSEYGYFLLVDGEGRVVSVVDGGVVSVHHPFDDWEMKKLALGSIPRGRLVNLD